MENIGPILAFTLPIIIVIGMAIKPAWFAGQKTNVQAAIVGGIGFAQSFDLPFLSADVTASMTAGAGFAVLIASKLTKRRPHGET